MRDGSWTIEPCNYAEAKALAEALEVSETTGLDPRPARLPRRRDGARLRRRRARAARPVPARRHGRAVERIRAAIADGRAHLRPRRLRRRRDLRDRARRPDACARSAPTSSGTCRAASRRATASRATRSRGSRTRAAALLLTVDCGITAVEEVAAAKARGLEVIVTDHHRPGPTLPDCPVVATRPSDYPFPELCGTGVVCKLAQALGVDVAPYLDLVALATIADVVPLLDENRSLAIAGLRALARTQRPGLQALMRNAHVDPAAVDAAAVGFRLAPRINAAGRLGRPDAALELLLTTDAEEAKRLADELETLNRDRQAVEERILRAAIAEVESWPEPKRRRRGYVIWGEDWHEGVIGIVASRLVERFNRPVVLIAGTERRVEGLRPFAARLRPARRARRVLRAPAPLRRPPRRGRALDRPGEPRRVRRRVRRARRRRARRGRPRARDPDRRDRARRGADARPGDGARAPRAVRARQPGRDAARPGLRGGAAGRRGRGKAPPLPHPAGRPRRRLGDRVRPRLAARPATRGPSATTSPAG